ncbi:MAG: hypothetical protein ACR2GI_07975, partial [Thermomicrobiales bacterium]
MQEGEGFALDLATLVRGVACAHAVRPRELRRWMLNRLALPVRLPYDRQRCRLPGHVRRHAHHEFPGIARVPI